MVKKEHTCSLEPNGIISVKLMKLVLEFAKNSGLEQMEHRVMAGGVG